MNKIIHWLFQTEIGRRMEIHLLMRLVTSTLRLPGQNMLFKNSAKALDIFASFTAEYLASCNHAQQQMLYDKAFRLGKNLRSLLTNRDYEALTSFTFLLYRNIGINMEGHFPGKVIVDRCHFCHYYSAKICNIASLMDAGVICGLFGGDKLIFTNRITEGKPHCICELSKKRK